jgi:hypothetical protein
VLSIYPYSRRRAVKPVTLSYALLDRLIQGLSEETLRVEHNGATGM